MKKVLKKMTVLSLALCLTSMAYNPIHAANDTNDIDYKPVFDASMQYAEKFEEIGISPEVLQEIMALEPKKESTTQNLSNNNDKVTNYFQKNKREPYNPKKYGLGYKDREKMISLMDGDNLDGNPPYTAAEQSERMIYIESVFQKEYYQDKYQSIHGAYLSYLYANHYTDNINYDRTKEPNFDEMYAQIVCKDDIIEYDKFYASMYQGAYVDAFKAGASAFQDIKTIIKDGVSTADLLTKDIVDAKEVVSNKIDFISIVIMSENNYTNEIMDGITLAFMENYNSVENADQMISIINKELAESGGVSEAMNDLIKDYVDLTFTVITSPLVTGLVGPILAVTFFYANVLSTLMPVLNLTKLLVSHNARWGYRAFIYYGMDPRP